MSGPYREDGIPSESDLQMEMNRTEPVYVPKAVYDEFQAAKELVAELARRWQIVSEEEDVLDKQLGEARERLRNVQGRYLDALRTAAGIVEPSAHGLKR